MLSKKKLIAVALVLGVLVLAFASQGVKKTFWGNYQSGSTAGLGIETLRPGSGDRLVAKGDRVVVDYIGALQDGTTLESSYQQGQPRTLQIGEDSVLKGWNQGIVGMRVGERRKLTIAPELAYGSVGKANVPADATLVFEIELLEIK